MSYRFFTVSGFYGSHHTPTDVFCAADRHGLTWYVADGAQTVNATFDELTDGVNIELLTDIDCFTVDPVNSLDDLENSLNN
jgi:hypothetical protein